MADVNFVEFSQFQILIGDGGDPEEFTPRCTINTERSFTITPAYNDIEIPDCENAELPSAIFKRATSVTGEVSGSGVMEADDAEFFSDWCLAATAKNVKVICGTSDAGRQWTFAGRPGPFSPSVSKNNVVNAEVSIMTDGRITSGAVPAS